MKETADASYGCSSPCHADTPAAAAASFKLLKELE
jgi:hypothetical protein